MFVYKKAKPTVTRLYKSKHSEKAKKALKRIQEMLKQHEKEITAALLFLWLTAEEEIDEFTVTEALSDKRKADNINDKYDEYLYEFADENLLPMFDSVGEQAFKTTYEDNKDIITMPDSQVIKPTSIHSPILPIEAPENITMPQTNQFDYGAFYGKWCDKRAGNLIVELNEVQHQNVKSILNDVTRQGDISLQSVTRRIKDTVGLTQRQLGANQKYYNNIRRSLKETNPRLSEKEIDRRAGEAAKKYADRQRTDRAKSIARSELNAAHNQAAYSYVKWCIEHGYMKNVYRKWATSGNDNVCPICLALNGQITPFDKPYKVPSRVKYNGNEIMSPPAHTSCCCGEEFIEGNKNVSNPPSEWDKMTDAEKTAHINYHSDKEQYKAYKKRLGRDNVPKSLEKFQDLKYNNTEEWNELKAQYNSSNPKYNHTGYKRSEDGVIIATNHRQGGSVPKVLKPYAVLDMEKKDGHIERTFYDKDGNISKQIHPTNHGNPKLHPYGKNGEHTHTYVWKDSELSERKTREMTDRERKDNSDIL